MADSPESIPNTSIGASPPVAKPTPSGTFVVLAMGGFFLFILLNLLGWVFFARKPENLKKRGESALKALGNVPDFHLTERNGQAVGLDSLQGKVWIADFIFTRCGGSCPVMSANMKNLRDAFAQPSLPQRASRTSNENLRFVSFTVDPQNDTLETLQRYGKAYGAEGSQWMFLTGGYDAIQKLAHDGFHLGIEPGNGSGPEPIIHSQSFVLVDAHARIRGYYDGTDGSEVKKLFEDAQKLLRSGE